MVTTEELKHRIVLRQCQILDSNLSDAEKRERLKPLFDEFSKIKKKSKTKIITRADMSVRLTNQETGEIRYFKRMGDAANFFGRSKSWLGDRMKKSRAVEGYICEKRLRKYRYQKDGVIIIGTAAEIVNKTEVKNVGARAGDFTKKGAITEIDRWM